MTKPPAEVPVAEAPPPGTNLPAVIPVPEAGKSGGPRNSTREGMLNEIRVG